ncbi:alpha-terpineol synthase, chloroplastic-like [Macadamia integrifolia]|uniref:alpha-terpineol synthase, chloroplastic-like n=1 Tax=Macadamia integrifolia TaxID=60698 RepID=UPI001C4EA3D2|nr:alpha-terpineol synthase, chloroplastic-like [Macadamia integrifolia]
MALNLNILSIPSYSSKAGFIHHRSLPQRPLTHQSMISSNIKCLQTTHSIDDPTIIRRSANYQRSIWDFDFIQSLKSDYKWETYKSKTNKLEEEVRHRFNDDGTMRQLLGLLELIDDIERLGLGYLFEEEIKKTLDTIMCMEDIKESLHATALRFRLLRQHGHEVNQDTFNHLKDEMGNYMASYFADVNGILSFYEACHLAAEGENILEEAKQFTRTVLKGMKDNIDSNLEKQVNHALELPLHKRITKLEAELERGDALKSIQSYMYETGASEDMAREQVGHMIDETWKKMNTDVIKNEFLLSQPFIKTAINLARMSLCIYQYGDGHGVFDDENKNRAESLLFEPIPLLMDA